MFSIVALPPPALWLLKPNPSTKNRRENLGCGMIIKIS